MALPLRFFAVPVVLAGINADPGVGAADDDEGASLGID